MYDFDVLLDEILRSRPEIDRSKIIEQIEEKKNSIGSGFLTDQGALFLIAGELGVPLRHLTSTDLTLKDLYVGANDITIVARVLAVYPISEYKKKDGGVGRYRKLNLFDQGNIARLTIWDDNEEAIQLAGISVDMPVRVMNGYVRQGLDGKPNLNLGKRGKIEPLNDEALVSRLMPLTKLSKRLKQIGEDDVNILALEGIAWSGSRTSNFVRSSDGSPGSLMQFELSEAGGSSRIRVVIWNPGGETPEVKPGVSVLVTNLRQKRGNQGDTELHGDGGSVVKILDGSVGGPGDIPPAPSTATVGGVATAPAPVRTAKFTKVEKVKEAIGPISLEVMALSKGTIRDAILRDGSTVKKAELVIGDDTGEITIIGWRDIAQRLMGIEVGQRIKVFDVSRQASKLGVETLQLEGQSRIEVISVS
jgi:ssDNA-binding replication factor A large subunit